MMNIAKKRREHPFSFGVIRVAGYDSGGVSKTDPGNKKEKVITQIKTLYVQMQEAVKREDYERAAEIRDKIRELAKEM